jgi:hypothetical protein
MCFVWISEQTAIISLYSIKSLLSIHVADSATYSLSALGINSAVNFFSRPGEHLASYARDVRTFRPQLERINRFS